MTSTSHEFYEEPDEPLRRRRFIEYKTQFIEPLFPADTSIRITDLACGYGLFLDACRRLGYRHVEGVEAGETFVHYAHTMLGVTSITRGDLFSYLESRADGYFDVITAFNIVEHVKKEHVQELLGLIYKKLKRGGLFIMEVPNADSPLGVHTYFTDLTHEFAFSRTLAVRLLKIAGFTGTEVRYQPNLRHPLIKLAQKILAKVVGLDAEAMFSGNIILVGHKDASSGR